MIPPSPVTLQGCSTPRLNWNKPRKPSTISTPAGPNWKRRPAFSHWPFSPTQSLTADDTDETDGMLIPEFHHRSQIKTDHCWVSTIEIPSHGERIQGIAIQ